MPLPPKVTLPSYPTYMFSVGGLIMILGVLLLNLLILFSNLKKEMLGSIFNYSVLLGVIICILSIIPRYYLGNKIDKAQYIQCTNEHYSSAKISWDVYAESDDLCKSK
jgi:hypothetical protein